MIKKQTLNFEDYVFVGKKNIDPVGEIEIYSPKNLKMKKIFRKSFLV